MSSENPLVSVVIPVYNAGKYLDETIQSVRNQTYPNWELVLVDDGSSDNSASLAKKYATEYPGRIRYFEHPGRQNRGSSATRNVGIKHAKGELIAFLDADDLFAAEYLADQVQTWLTTKASMICQATLYWHSWDDPAKKPSDIVKPVGVPQDRLYEPGELNLKLYPLKRKAAPCPSAIIATKTSLLHIGGFEASFTGMYDDQAFLSKMYYHEPVYISSSCHNFYRIRTDSLMSTVNDPEAYHHYRKKFFSWFKTYLENETNPDKTIYRAVKKKWLSYHHPICYRLRYAAPGKIYSRILRILKS